MPEWLAAASFVAGRQEHSGIGMKDKSLSGFCQYDFVAEPVFSGVFERADQPAGTIGYAVKAVFPKEKIPVLQFYIPLFVLRRQYQATVGIHDAVMAVLLVLQSDAVLRSDCTNASII